MTGSQNKELKPYMLKSGETIDGIDDGV